MLWWEEKRKWILYCIMVECIKYKSTHRWTWLQKLSTNQAQQTQRNYYQHDHKHKLHFKYKHNSNSNNNKRSKRHFQLYYYGWKKEKKGEKRHGKMPVFLFVKFKIVRMLSIVRIVLMALVYYYIKCLEYSHSFFFVMFFLLLCHLIAIEYLKWTHFYNKLFIVIFCRRLF